MFEDYVNNDDILKTNNDSANSTWVFTDCMDRKNYPQCSLCNNQTDECCHTSNETTLTPNPESVLDPWENVPDLSVTTAITVPCMVGGLVGNIAVLAVMLSDKKSRNRETWRTNMFLVSLAMADLLLVMVAAPTQLLQYFSRQSPVSGTSCKVSEYFRVLSAAASILNLTAVTLERFVVIVYPMRSRSICTTSNCRRALIIVWVTAMVLASPVVLIKNVYPIWYANCSYEVPIYYCNDQEDIYSVYYYIYQLTVVFCLPCLVMIVCYSLVITTLWRATKTMASMTSCSVRRPDPAPSAAGVKDMKGERKQVIKMLILVVVLFIFCWGPRFMMETLLKAHILPGVLMFNPFVVWLKNILFLLPFIHAIINPLVYFMMSNNFRQSFIKVCCSSGPLLQNGDARTGCTTANTTGYTSVRYTRNSGITKTASRDQSDRMTLNRLKEETGETESQCREETAI